jgi:DNA primase
VEGPGDVWRLWEAGIENAVAMFGAGLTDEQQIVIERSGAMNISIVRDNDATGEMSEAKLKDELSFYKLRFIVPPAGYKDVGAMPTELVQKEIIPCLG